MPVKQVVQANPDKPGESAAAPPSERKIIYVSQISLVVEDIAATQQKLNVLINSIFESGGYLARYELSGSNTIHRQGSWTIRVPLAKFDRFVAQLEQMGELERSSRDAQDVTEAYTDLEARLRNKQLSEKRLLSHLEKAAVLKDTLELENELSRVRGEVEQLQGQLNLLKSKTDLATVTLTLYERRDYKPPTKPTFGTTVSRTFDSSLTSLRAFGELLLLAVVALLPWAVTIAVTLLPVWLIRRRLHPPHPQAIRQN